VSSAAREHLRHEESALLATPDDEAAFIAAAERLAREPALAGRLGRAARASAERLTWQRIVEDFEAVLFNVAA
jgi:glycosyltransferase involved in cell wall biosynthesis